MPELPEENPKIIPLSVESLDLEMEKKERRDQAARQLVFIQETLAKMHVPNDRWREHKVLYILEHNPLVLSADPNIFIPAIPPSIVLTALSKRTGGDAPGLPAISWIFLNPNKIISGPQTHSEVLASLTNAVGAMKYHSGYMHLLICFPPNLKEVQRNIVETQLQMSLNSEYPDIMFYIYSYSQADGEPVIEISEFDGKERMIVYRVHPLPEAVHPSYTELTISMVRELQEASIITRGFTMVLDNESRRLLLELKEEALAFYKTQNVETRGRRRFVFKKNPTIRLERPIKPEDLEEYRKQLAGTAHELTEEMMVTYKQKLAQQHLEVEFETAEFVTSTPKDPDVIPSILLQGKIKSYDMMKEVSEMFAFASRPEGREVYIVITGKDRSMRYRTIKVYADYDTAKEDLT